MLRFSFLFILCVFLMSCEDPVTVKPNAKLRLEFPSAAYKRIDKDCPYSFEKNESAALKKTKNCGMNVQYSKMNATIYLTYQSVRNNNLDSLVYDAQKLAYDHNIKAESIPEQPFVNPNNNVYGMFYKINGNAASQSHFYVTDSVNHFVTGSLYFDAKPNFDSIYPAVVYLREDIRKIMETIRWKE
ncbi:gliding motility lipoprotein GldD [Ulvibacter antarcticus]|uniref:Protein involved in gliding motility GldD n=1 Tax=Ulvibacter antarcticus TaxID=442714 RepID=A0A3L9Z2V8_9FLAO|nr:gliding motility lipoprotein GldD [Ulvibacter antarcticus]RMA65759.1 protein involved in gliding motility GldD [Ulvibacter antarcticus]